VTGDLKLPFLVIKRIKNYFVNKKRQPKPSFLVKKSNLPFFKILEKEFIDFDYNSAIWF